MSLIESELNRRLNLFQNAKQIESQRPLRAQDLTDLGIYGGKSGVWVNKSTTERIDPVGIAVGLLHTGKHYDDDIDETGILYHYPTTDRAGLRDSNEIAAIKNLKVYNLPVFIITIEGNSRKIDLAWLDDFDDALRICVLTFHGVDYRNNSFRVKKIEEKVELFGSHRKTKSEVVRAERDPKFKFNILQRFDGICIATGIDVIQVLDAAHIIPVANRGTESVENGLLLSANAHRALDSGLWAINPYTLQIETKKDGPSAERMKLHITDLRHQADKLNLEALEYRYKKLFLQGVTK